MRFCFPFLATDWSQFDSAWADEGHGAEAVLFDSRDVLDPERYALVETNLRRAHEHLGSRLLFHFPVDSANYVDDLAVRDRLWACLDLAAELELGGVVLHSNIVEAVRSWDRSRAQDARRRFVEFLPELSRRVEGAPMWLGLENMPIMGNYGRDMDPTLVFPADFEGLCGGNLGITWDLCHWSYTVYVVQQLRSGALDEAEHYPHLLQADFLDFARLHEHIVHYHFSAFRGLARVDGGGAKQCREGVAPWEASVPETIYEQMLAEMPRAARADTTTFEVEELDYRERPRTRAVMAWCRERMRSPGLPRPGRAEPAVPEQPRTQDDRDE